MTEEKGNSYRSGIKDNKKMSEEEKIGQLFREYIKIQNPYVDMEEQVLKHICDYYLDKMKKYVEENNVKISEVNALLLNVESIVFYIGTDFLAVEYEGNAFSDSIKSEGSIVVKTFDYTGLPANEFIANVIGIGIERYNFFPTMINSQDCENLFLPTNDGLLLMTDLGWNFVAEESVLGVNAGYLELTKGVFHRLINCRFFDAVNGGLKTRIAKWIDFFPCIMKENVIDEENIQVEYSVQFPLDYESLWEKDVFYKLPIPNDYKFQKLPQLNRFIETFGDVSKSETDITNFLSQPENEFILTMGFGCKEVIAQINCEWQSEERNAIKPDFFAIKANGYADIIEFKLPRLKGNAIVGVENRKTFSAEMNSYISQTRQYAKYFEDPNNRRWIEENYGFIADKPRRFLVVGRRSDFGTKEWSEIKTDYTNFEIVTCDDLVDTVIAQFYK